MAFKIIWARQAREDLRDIVTFIALDNPIAAETFGYLLMTKVDTLASFPRLGRIVPEENDEDIREVIFRSYRIVYLVIEKQQVVAIMRVWHGARGEPVIPERMDF
jgi:plasmid stabilization system protein ParE